ncbi:pitrilysin family protein [Marinilabiliaceae bacterium ANBcel2]|nr:pitrilysin family protein [Marinilabiliaceae bacterium ANBcel2]
MIETADRQHGPGFEEVEKIEFLPVKRFTLKNRIDVALIEAGSQDVTKIDLVFPAGAVQAGRPLISSTTGHLLTEGTRMRSAAEISGILDYFGAFLNTQTYHHNSIVTLICLTKDLPELLELVEELVKEPVFSESEFKIHINKRRQEFVVNSQKVKTIAGRKFHNVIFGEDHPYGKQPVIKDFDILTRDEIAEFHKRSYIADGAKIIVSGQPGNNIQKLLDKHFGMPQWSNGSPVLNGAGNISPSLQREHIVNIDGALQSALRLGRPLFNNLHPDIFTLQIVNAILGGYFGSRLMTSVREQKGLTYGIGSSIISLKKAGVWVIASEVAGDKREAAVDAIYEEMEKLRNVAVSPHELATVKSFMMGELLRNFDGPFATSDIYRTLWDFDLDFDFYRKMTDEIRTITPDKILEYSKKYLNPDDFYLVVAGR